MIEKHSKINEICRGKRGISAEMAVKLGKAFSQTPDLWMGLQNEWENIDKEIQSEIKNTWKEIVKEEINKE